MAEKEIEKTSNPVLETVEKKPFNIEHFFNENQKALGIGVGILAVVILGLVYFFVKYLPEKNQEAQRMMYKAEAAFATDSFQLALKGNAKQKGFEFIASEYGLTKAGKLAHYYAGICNLNLKKWDAAIDHLDDFTTSDPILKSVSLSAIGDAHMEKGKTDDGINYYEKAVSAATSEDLKPYFLNKLALANMKFNKKDDAIENFIELRDKFPLTAEGQEAEKYIFLLDPTKAK